MRARSGPKKRVGEVKRLVFAQVTRLDRYRFWRDSMESRTENGRRVERYPTSVDHLMGVRGLSEAKLTSISRSGMEDV